MIDLIARTKHTRKHQLEDNSYERRTLDNDGLQFMVWYSEIEAEPMAASLIRLAQKLSSSTPR